MVLLEYVTQPKKWSRQGSYESKEELAVRQSSPKSWTVAFIPTPETFAPLPTKSEVGVMVEIQWGLPPSLQQLSTQTVGFPILSLSEVGTTVSADHLLQWPRCPLNTNLRPWAFPTRYRSPINLTEPKNCCVAYMPSSDFWQRPIPRGIVPKPLALDSSCALQLARTVPIFFLLRYLLSVVH